MDVHALWNLMLQLGPWSWADFLTALAIPAVAVLVGAAIAIGLALGNGPATGAER